MAASSVARTPVDAARTTIKLTTSTPTRSIATTRSGNVGPFTRRTTAIRSAKARVISANCVLNAIIVTSSLPKQPLDALFEAALDVVPARRGGRHVHHVNVQGAPVIRKVDRHAT